MSHVTHFREVRPFLEAEDVRATAEYYRDVFGFEIGDHIDGDDGDWAWVSVRRGGVGFMFTPRHTHGEEAGHDHPEHPVLTGSLYINVDDVDAFASEIGSKLDLAYGPVTLPHGMREVAVVDPNGYFLVFGAPAG